MFNIGNVLWFIAGYWVCFFTISYGGDDGLLFSVLGGILGLTLWAVIWYLSHTFEIVRINPNEPSRHIPAPPPPSTVVPPAPDTRG